MKNSKHYGTVMFSLINITYFMAFCVIHAFAAVYLLDKGFSNKSVGVFLAVANILSALFQPVIASLIDKYVKITNRACSLISAIIIAAGSGVLLVTSSNRVVVFIVFSIIYMIQFTYMPILTALSFEYQKKGCNIFFGLARGLGSAGFAVTSMFIGTLVENKGVDCLLVAAILIMAAHVALLYIFKEPTAEEIPDSCTDDAVSDEVVSESDSPAEPLSLPAFIRKYPVFLILLIATTLLFFTHNMLNDYLIQIIRNIGGSESNLGYATFIAALLELPTMAVVSVVSKKVRMTRLLILSGVFFTIKSIIMLLATGMFMVYLSQAMQMFAYAVFIPASAYYVSETISQSDQVKGQALITSCFTLAGVFSGLICGAILDSSGVKPMLITGVAISVAGTLTIIFAMHKSDKNA